MRLPLQEQRISLLVLRSKMRLPLQEQRISLLVLRSKMRLPLQEQRISLLVLRSKMRLPLQEQRISLLVLRSKMRLPLQEQRISLLVLRSKMSAMLLLHSMCLLQEQCPAHWAIFFSFSFAFPFLSAVNKKPPFVLLFIHLPYILMGNSGCFQINQYKTF